MLPQYTTTERNALSPTAGQQIYNTTDNATQVYSNSTWSDLENTESGLLPTYTTTERNALSPITGLMIYNTDNFRIEYYTPSGWSYTVGPRANGVLCGSNPDCITEYCVDGYCCNTGCNGTCVSCSAVLKGEGENGTCGFVIDTKPDDTCTSTHYRCDGSGLCTAPTYHSGCITFGGYSEGTAQCWQWDGCVSAYQDDNCLDTPGSCSGNSRSCICWGYTYD